MPPSLTHQIDPPLPDSLIHEARPQEPELFGQDRLERHAVALAGLYRLAPDPVRGRPLLPRLDESAQELDDAYRFLSTAVTKGAPAVGFGGLAQGQPPRRAGSSPRDSVRTCRAGTTCSLPKLADGPLAAVPTYLRLRARAHDPHRGSPSTSRPSPTSRPRISERLPLTIGEIWAIPMMLRLALVEELRRLAADSCRRAAVAIARVPGACN